MSRNIFGNTNLDQFTGRRWRDASSIIDAPEWTFASSTEPLPHTTSLPGLYQFTATYDHTNASTAYSKHL